MAPTEPALTTSQVTQAAPYVSIKDYAATLLPGAYQALPATTLAAVEKAIVTYNQVPLKLKEGVVVNFVPSGNKSGVLVPQAGPNVIVGGGGGGRPGSFTWQWWGASWWASQCLAVNIVDNLGNAYPIELMFDAMGGPVGLALSIVLALSGPAISAANSRCGADGVTFNAGAAIPVYPACWWPCGWTAW
jgi:hypothetical protein